MIGKIRSTLRNRRAEFALAEAMVAARARAGLTQDELAHRMRTTQPVVARLESGRVRPSMRTLERLAEATGSRLLISFYPRDAKQKTSKPIESRIRQSQIRLVVTSIR